MLLSSVPALAQSPNCSAAVPNDNNDDTDAINSCLATYPYQVVLASGTYNIGFGSESGVYQGKALYLGQDGATLVGQGISETTLLAAANLWAPMMYADANAWVISDLNFDGNALNRTEDDECNGDDRTGGSGILAYGDGYEIDMVGLWFTLCGTSLGAEGQNFEIENVAVFASGYLSGSGDAPWADGITIWDCEDAVITNNWVWDATDIGIVIGGGDGCEVSYNLIENTLSRAFAGIHVGWFSQGDGDHGTNEIFENEVAAFEDKLAFGIVVGFHPWDSGYWVSNAGSVYDNYVDGGLVNIAVDGVGSGAVYDNTAVNFQGTWGLGSCTATESLTADHYDTIYLDPYETWVQVAFDDHCTS